MLIGLAAQMPDIAAQAEAARDADRVEEAIPLYRKALAARPAWAEGWWSLGTLLYDRDDYSEAAAAFAKATAVNPKAAKAWIMLGLCEANWVMTRPPPSITSSVAAQWKAGTIRGFGP
jgi:cytochrome c-type biogenesis protein CcmH/NrfG